MKTGTLYKLDNEYLRCIKIYESGFGAFQVCDKTGKIKPPKRNRNGFITDHGTRLVFSRLNELIEAT